MVVGHPDPAQGDVGVLDDPQRRLALDLGDRHALGVARDDEPAHLVRLEVARPDDDDVGERARCRSSACRRRAPTRRRRGARWSACRPRRRSPPSGSVSPNAPIVSIRAIDGSQRCRCSSVPPACDRAHREARVDAEEAVHRRVDPRDLRVQEAEEQAAGGLGPALAEPVGQPREVEVREALDQLHRELGALPGVLDQRGDVLAEVGAQAPQRRGLVVGEQVRVVEEVGHRVPVRGEVEGGPRQGGEVGRELGHALQRGPPRRGPPLITAGPCRDDACTIQANGRVRSRRAGRGRTRVERGGRRWTDRNRS